MEISAILFLICLIAFTVFFVISPFFNGRQAQKAEKYNERNSLLAERERLLSALSELDFDHSLGKIPAEDYPIQRMALLQRAANVLRQLDALSISSGGRTRKNVNVGKIITEAASPFSDDDFEDLLAKHRKTRKEKVSGFCSKCGKPVLQSDAFCPFCGKATKTDQKD